MLAGFTAFLSLYAPQPLLPALARVFDVSAGTISLTITTATLGMALASPLAGFISDRMGRRRLIIAAAFALAAFSILSAVAFALPFFLVTRFLLGAATPGVVAVTVAYIHDEWESHESGRATSAYITGTIFGGFLGRLLAGLIAARFDWNWVFLTLGLINLACALGLWKWLPKETHPPARTGSGARHSLLNHLRNPQLLATYAVGFCVLFTLTSSFTYINFHLAAPPFSLAPAALGALFFVYLIGAGATLIAGRSVDRIGSKKTLTIGVAGGVCGILLTLSFSIPLILAGLALCCSGVFVAQASTNSYLGKAATTDRALAIGLYGTAYYGGGAVGAALPGLIWNDYRWIGCVTLIAIVQLITITLASTLWPRHEPSPAPR